MTITVAMIGKIAALDGLLGRINGGSGDATGDFEWLTSGDASIAVNNFSATAFPGSTDGGSGAATATANTIADSGLPTVSVTIAKFRTRDKANAEVFRGSVGTSGSGADLIMSSTSVPSDASTIQIPSLTFTYT